jgi:RNA polymerase primary sigma factor
MQQKQLTAKDIEQILILAQGCVSLNAPIVGADGEEDGELGDFIIDTAPSLEEQAIEREKNTMLLNYVEKYLTPREEAVIKLRYGLLDGTFKTFEEVGAMFNLTRERIRQIEQTAIRKLRHQFAKHNIVGDML